MRGFSLVLAQEPAPFGVQVTTIQPGGIRTDFAGSSMEIPPNSQPYEQTVGTFATMLREHFGQESSDPAKIARLLVDLANRTDAPAELLVGADAVEYVAQFTNAVAESDARWREVSVSTKA